MKKGGQTKPRCGAGQSCGFACIEASDTCTEKLDGAISKAAVGALRGHATAALATVATESTDFRGKSFAEVQGKFSANDAKHTIASTVVDHGGGITTQKVTLVASDGSGDTLTHTLLRMAADGDQPERIFTLADGMAKEYTDAAKHNYWNESRDAAVRAAISRTADVKAEAGTSPLRKTVSSELVASAEANMKQLLSSSALNINVTSGALPMILESGRLKSLFETAALSGSWNNKDMRAANEQTKLGYAVDSDPASRPIYATASSQENAKAGENYGDVVLRLKPEVRNRASVTLNDSLYKSTSGTPLLNPRIESALADEHYKSSDTEYVEALSKAKTVEELNLNGGYVEAQIHGGVSLDDIDTVLLTWGAKKKLTDLLDKHGVKWEVGQSFKAS